MQGYQKGACLAMTKSQCKLATLMKKGAAGTVHKFYLSVREYITHQSGLASETNIWDTIG